ncbi:MAG: DUF998 domain-containing protein [Pirellulaceae bacterium]|nr:DUF998 domain-containing protein [Pirellulaceae bacterium]
MSLLFSTRHFTAALGLSAVSIFVAAFFVFGALNPDFNLANDYVSKLGSRGQPFAFGWNLIGFGVVGLALATFGWFFGICKNDRVLGICLVVAGLGFALSAIPTDFDDEHSSFSKAHYVSICFGLAGWCFGLARITSNRSIDEFGRKISNCAIVLVLVPVVGITGGISAEPVAHRVVILVVFFWIVGNSMHLIRTVDERMGDRSR